MKLADIGPETENTFFHCLYIEGSEETRPTPARRRWYAEHQDKGYRAQVLVLDDGSIVGKCHYAPIEYSPFVGQDLLAILCIYVHMYQRPPGDQRGKGYGRFMLEQVEAYAREEGFKGVVAWAMDWDWNPVSFYERMGYVEVDREDKTVVVWKPFQVEAQPPSLLRLDPPPGAGVNKVRVVVADDAWCGNHDKLITAKEAIQGIEQMVDYVEVGAPCRDRIIGLGHVGGVYLDGEPYRPYQLIGASEDLRAEILRLHEHKHRGESQ